MFSAVPRLLPLMYALHIAKGKLVYFFPVPIYSYSSDFLISFLVDSGIFADQHTQNGIFSKDMYLLLFWQESQNSIMFILLNKAEKRHMKKKLCLILFRNKC